MMKNPKRIDTFKILGILLSYPEKIWVDGLDELISIIKNENVLNEELYEGLNRFSQYCVKQDLLDVQEQYVLLFDQNRSLSLHLFEHVHGESRDRGQAMVDLQEMYKMHGMEICKNELPDYLPLFLEFLSILPREECLEFLNNIMPIIKGIAKNLAEQGSEYVLIFNCLFHLGGEAVLTLPVIKKEIDIRALSEQFDREWEKEEEKFLANKFDSGCANSCQENSIHYVDANSIQKRNPKTEGKIL